MKIKIFYQRGSLTEFEEEINNFMAAVNVVDVKLTEGTYGDYEAINCSLTAVIVYREINGVFNPVPTYHK